MIVIDDDFCAIFEILDALRLFRMAKWRFSFCFAFYLVDLGVEAYYIGESYKVVDGIRSFTYTRRDRVGTQAKHVTRLQPFFRCLIFTT